MLYVAFTRAEQMLFVIAGKPKGTLNLSKYFVDFINSVKSKEDLENKYCYGRTTKPHKQNKLNENIIEIKLNSINWREKIKVV